MGNRQEERGCDDGMVPLSLLATVVRHVVWICSLQIAFFALGYCTLVKRYHKLHCASWTLTYRLYYCCVSPVVTHEHTVPFHTPCLVPLNFRLRRTSRMSLAHNKDLSKEQRAYGARHLFVFHSTTPGAEPQLFAVLLDALHKHPNLLALALRGAGQHVYEELKGHRAEYQLQAEKNGEPAMLGHKVDRVWLLDPRAGESHQPTLRAFPAQYTVDLSQLQ